MKFKGLTELLTDDHLKYPPKGAYDTANELEQNKKMLSKFEYLVKKKEFTWRTRSWDLITYIRKET